MDKLITVPFKDYKKLRDGNITDFLLNMVKIGSALGPVEIESIKGPYDSKEDGYLFIIRYQDKREVPKS